MRYYELLNYAKMIFLGMFISFLIIAIYVSRGENLDEKTAGAVCIKMVNDYVSNQFKVSGIKYNKLYKITTSRLDMYVEYSNGRKYFTSCYFKTKFIGSEILLRKAVMRDSKGKSVVFDNVVIQYNDNK